MAFHRDSEVTEFAEFLIAQFGAEKAYEAGRGAMREARARCDAQAERFFSKVALTIADMTGREVGMTGADRYLAH